MTDRRTFTAVVVILGVALLTCIAGIIGLAVVDKAAPAVLENVAVGVFGGLVGLLGRAPATDPTPVEVVSPKPLPVEETP